jgi:hypothetical protein
LVWRFHIFSWWSLLLDKVLVSVPVIFKLDDYPKFLRLYVPGPEVRSRRVCERRS